jgi:hypothetical protein
MVFNWVGDRNITLDYSLSAFLFSGLTQTTSRHIDPPFGGEISTFGDLEMGISPSFLSRNERFYFCFA